MAHRGFGRTGKMYPQRPPKALKAAPDHQPKLIWVKTPWLSDLGIEQEPLKSVQIKRPGKVCTDTPERAGC